MLDWKWSSKRILIFANVVLTRTLGARKAREIWTRINRQLDLRERGIHSGLVRDVLADKRAREVHVKGRKEEKDDCLARSL